MRWNIDPILFELGPLEIRWYGLFFATGLLMGVEAMHRAFARRGFPKQHASTLTWLLPVGMIVGAHLLHLVFYEPRSFIDNPRRIIEIGSGLASHGGGIGTALALYLYARAKGARFHHYGDCVIVGAVWIIPMVRVGNFFNSEIVGRVTDVPWAVIFERVGEQPRHPSQLYEAAIGFALAGFATWYEHKRSRKAPAGSAFYLMLFLYFTSRFLIEYVKEYQALSEAFPFTMGQLLSVPLALALLFMYFWVRRNETPIGEAPAKRPSASPAPQAEARPSASARKHKAKSKKRKGKGR